MYEKIVADFKAITPNLPAKPTLELGLAIKHIRLCKGMTQDELATHTQIKAAALKTLENGYARFTKLLYLEKIAAAFNITLKELLMEAREWSQSNFCVFKMGSTEETPGKRKKKFRKDSWLQKRPLPYSTFQAEVITSGISNPKHMTFIRMEINPGKSALNLKLPWPQPITGFVEWGSLKLVYDGKETPLLTGQGFSMRGDKSHYFVNRDKANSAKLFLAFSLHPIPGISREEHPTHNHLSVGDALQSIRHIYSSSKNRPLSFVELSARTGLDEKSLQYLETTKEPDQVIYWDKIEQLTQGLRIPFKSFLDLAKGQDPGYVRVATAHDRALIDYRHYLGIRIKSALLPGTDNKFQMAEIYIEPSGGIRRLSWKRKDEAMMVVYVMDGTLLIEVGKNRKTQLQVGESIYFDASLGYRFINEAQSPCKIFLVSHPAIIF